METGLCFVLENTSLGHLPKASSIDSSALYNTFSYRSDLYQIQIYNYIEHHFEIL